VGQQAAAVAVGPVTAPPPPLTAALAGFVVIEARSDDRLRFHQRTVVTRHPPRPPQEHRVILRQPQVMLR
jgi:hypothetical protein